MRIGESLRQRRVALLTSIVSAYLLISGTSAHAICAPAAGNDVSATCTATTTNQNGTNGYGTGVETNLTTTVVQGATVTGTLNGIDFLTGLVNNSGSINGGGGFGTAGVSIQGAGKVINSGDITGNRSGVLPGAGSSVTNSGSIVGTTLHGIAGQGDLIVQNSTSGTIRGASSGINSIGNVGVTNSGLIVGTSLYGIAGEAAVTVTNSGQIQGGLRGILATGLLNLTNSGTVTGVTNDAIAGRADVIVNNSGTVNGGRLSILAVGSATINNSGIMTSAAQGIQAQTLDLINSGHISNGGGTTNVRSLGTATVVNSGTIVGSGDAFLANGAATLTNSGTISTSLFAVGSLVTVTAVNSGTISGRVAISANDGVTVMNSGNIVGDELAVTSAGGAATVINSGTITALFSAVRAHTTADVTNSGTITSTGDGGVAGVFSESVATVRNSGLINGETGVLSYGNATVNNSGTVRGLFNAVAADVGVVVTNSGTVTANLYDAISAGASATVTNSGTIAGGGTIYAGVFSNGTVDVNNSGTISGGYGVLTGRSGVVTNSGTIIGTNGTAVRFRFSASPNAPSSTLNVLPGARFGGQIYFGGGADKVNFGAGSWIINTLNFNAAVSTITTPGNPYVVTPNQIVVADVSSFGTQNRAVMAITGWIASVLPDAPVFAPATGGGINSFAAADTIASPFEAFGSVAPEALGYAATKAPAFKAGAVNYADGSAVWTKVFGGQRQQDMSGATFGSTTTGYGGAIGYDRMINPDLKIGALIGGSSNRTDLYLSAGSTTTDTMFGGLYGRATRGGSFLDLSVIGGNLDNKNTRNIGGGLAMQAASANYGGWFVTPALMLGHRFDLGRGFTLTPAVKVRYLTAHFDGYTETGSTANMTVGGRDFGAVEERAEITLANTRMIGNGNLVTARVTGGFLGQQRSTGNNQINVVLMGQNFIATTTDRGSIAGAFAAGGIDWQMGRVTLFAAGEGTYTNDAARSYSGKGGVRLAW